EFGIRPENIRLIGLEYGVNIQPPIETDSILNHCYQHKGKDFDKEINKQGMKYRQVEHSAYFLKIYDKALQFGRLQRILRVEIKVKNWSKYRRQGIVTLKDFIEADK